MKKDIETLAAIDYFYGPAGVVRPNGANKAAALAIKAAVEINPTYSEDADIEKIHKTWTKELIKYLDKYRKEGQTKEVFIADVMDLQQKMNEVFPDSFKNNGKKLNKDKGRDKNYARVFRIAHAQKSLSIFLKHMWCITPDMPMPPVCPIDRKILQEAKIYDSWTKLNCIKKYKEWLNKIENVAGKEPLSRWELVKWNQPSEQASETNKKEKQATKKSDKLIDNQTPPYRMKEGHEVLEEEAVNIKGHSILLILAQTKNGSHFCGFWNKNVPNTNFDLIPEIQDIITKLSLSSLKWQNKPEYSRKYVMFRKKDSIKAKELKDKISEFIHNMAK